MRSAQQQSDRRPPANTVRTPNNNFNYMNGSQRGPQPVPSNGYVYFYYEFLMLSNNIFYYFLKELMMKKNG